MAEPSAPPLPPPSYDDVMSGVPDDFIAGDLNNTSANTESANEGGGASSSTSTSPTASNLHRRQQPSASGQGSTGPFSDSKSPYAPSSVGEPSVYSESEPLIPNPQYGQAAVPPLSGGHGSPDGLSSREFFASLEYKRSSKGYSSSDVWLNTNAQALLRFLMECNERPRVSVEVEGKLVERTYTENGQTRHETHTRQDRVVDFKFSLELTPYIHEKGNLYTARGPNGQPYDIDKILAGYVRTENVLKEIRVQKKVIWDYDLVRREIVNFVKNTGYPHSVSVSFPMENDRIVVKSHNGVAKVWRHPVTSFLCFITCACIIGWPLQYFATKRWRNKVHSDFVVVASPRDFVARNAEFIRNQVSWSTRPYPFPVPH
ncbi:hypothetical protein GQ54DRAFT_258090 [Martensiomyces pterosporus]|nr:hypothetical protein GQ54DRAFT_258090 [Martensiomyces pterosporus]